MAPNRRDWRGRFIRKVDIRGDDECWPWLGSLFQKTGYGHFWMGPGDDRLAHRVS